MNKFQIYLITECSNAFAKGYSNDWEEDFIISLEDKPDSYDLSEKQNHILTRIHNTVANEGYI